MKNLSLLFWFLAGVAATTSVYFRCRIIDALALVFLIGSYISGRKAIRNAWDKERTWWQINNSIQFAMTFQSVNFAIASFLAVYTFIRWDQFEKDAMNRTFGLFLFLSISLGSWFIGRGARIAAERALIPPPPPQPKIRPFSEEVLRKVGDI